MPYIIFFTVYVLILCFSFFKSAGNSNKTGWGGWGIVSRVLCVAFPFILIYVLYTTKVLG